MDDAGIPLEHRYPHNSGNQALRDFLQWLDQNDNHIITDKELKNLAVKACGYSWGGVSAIGFTQRLSTAGTIVVGGSPGNPISYALQAPVSIEALATIDPVAWLNPPGTVPGTVKSFHNWYQMKGGKPTWRLADGTVYDDSADWLSGLIKGVYVDSQAQSSFQVRVELLDPIVVRSGKPFNTLELYLQSNEVNHDVMPWFTRQDMSQPMQ
jgi:pimeloyl-ACP methyl ester carboxylesterase